MESSIASSFFYRYPYLASGQDITDQWNSEINVTGSQLRLVFHIKKTDSGFSAAFSSPYQRMDYRTYEVTEIKV